MRGYGRARDSDASGTFTVCDFVRDPVWDCKRRDLCVGELVREPSCVSHGDHLNNPNPIVNPPAPCPASAAMHSLSLIHI